MIYLAMSLGPPIELIIAVFCLLFIVSVFVLLSIIKLFYKKISWKIVWKATIGIPVGFALIILLWIAVNDFINSPMTVRKFYLEGDYVINRDYFKGDNTNWQYEHYHLSVTDDSLFLHVMNNGVEIATYSRHIKYIPEYLAYKGRNHTFFEFDDFMDRKIAYRTLERSGIIDSLPQHKVQSWEEVSMRSKKVDSLLQSEFHHVIAENPKLHADPFSFNIVLHSRKYGNMFFTKGKWRKN